MNPDNPFQPLFDAQLKASHRLRQESARQRLDRLRRLEAALSDFESDIASALKSDFRKPYEEVLLTEIAPVVLEIRHTRRNLHRWMKPKRVGTPAVLSGTTSHVRYAAKGPSLIISPWNYAFTLTLGPVVSAIAAGCPIIVKPSEYAPEAANVLTHLLGQVFPEDEVAVCPGGPDVAQSLLELPFQHIFFTGSTTIGRQIVAAASKHMPSMTLELGGKSPAIVDATANLRDTARRLAFGKFANAGQTCIAPDFLLVHESVAEEFITALIAAIQRLYGENTDAASPPGDLSRVVTRDHTARLAQLLEEARSLGAKVRYGGSSDLEQNYLEPTLLTDVPAEARIMKEEIFGPILPIQTFREIDELLEILSRQSPPLSTYLFSRNNTTAARLSKEVQSGCIVINETLLHFANPHLPFGGTTSSGTGQGHGYAGFRAFSNVKGVFRQHGSPWLLGHLHPPFSRCTQRWLRALIRFS